MSIVLLSVHPQRKWNPSGNGLQPYFPPDQNGDPRYNSYSAVLKLNLQYALANSKIRSASQASSADSMRAKIASAKIVEFFCHPWCANIPFFTTAFLPMFCFVCCVDCHLAARGMKGLL